VIYINTDTHKTHYNNLGPLPYEIKNSLIKCSSYNITLVTYTQRASDV
jgi:hypothetical protein